MAVQENGNGVKLLISTTSSGTKTAIASAESFDFTLGDAVIDITTLDSDGWEDIASGKKTWSISSTGIVVWDEASAVATHATDELLAHMLTTDNTFYIDFGFGTKILRGTAKIDTNSVSATNNEKTVATANFRGKGALAFASIT